MHWNTSFNNFCSISVTQSKERVAATASRELAVVEEVVDASPNTIVGFGERVRQSRQKTNPASCRRATSVVAAARRCGRA